MGVVLSSPALSLLAMPSANAPITSLVSGSTEQKESVPKQRTSYLPALTGLRAVAAWLVFFHHYPYGQPPAAGWPRLARYLLMELHGLPLLLLLSGFLIALRYDDGSSGFRPRGGWRTYLQTRLARIYPLFAVATLLTFAWLWRWHSPHATLGMLLLHLSLLRGFFDEYKFFGIGQAWSLTLLECFYLAAPLLFGLYLKISSPAAGDSARATLSRILVAIRYSLKRVPTASTTLRFKTFRLSY